MIYTDCIQAVISRARNSGGSLSLACLFLLCPAVAQAQQVVAPAPETPPAAPAAQIGIRTPRAPRAPAAPVQTPAAPAPSARPVPPRKPNLPTVLVPPREVVTVVHRLSGWKLLVWLSMSGPLVPELDELPTLSDAHTNIVAGYVYEDGRSVVARLPQAEVELEAFNAPQVPASLFAQTGEQGPSEPEYLLVTSDGKHFEAKFVGLDSSTGLALLEAGESLLPAGPTGDAGDTDDPTVGQRVRLYAPVPADEPAPPARTPAQAPMPAAPGYIRLSIDQKEGRLTHIVRTPSGRLSSVVVGAAVSPEWVGAVAANELGEVVGIVSQSRDGETRVLPLTSVREACDRVLKLRGTVPQPWLGARGDAAAQASFQEWIANGWKPEAARLFIAKREGVLLNSVAPGTPAALAGLRAGDLITSVGPRNVRSNEDLSMTLKEAGVGSIVDLTVLRAQTTEPLKLSVELKGAKNPAFATAEAEWRAVSARVSALRGEVSELEDELRGLSADAASQENVARAASIRARLSDLKPKLRTDWELLKAAEERTVAARLFNLGPAPVLYGTQAAGRGDDVTRRLKTFGLHAIGLRSAAPLGARGGLFVIAVQPESPAASAGLLAGDVIETVNGSALWRFELRRLSNLPEAAPVVFGLVREGQRLSIKFQPAPAPEPQQ